MSYENKNADVAVFIDFENVYVSVRDKLDANPNFESIMDRCGDLGRVVIARAYADWYRYPRVTSALYANGIEPMYVPTYYYDKEMGRTGRAIKNSVDMNLCIDAMKTLFIHTNIARFVLVTGDRDFIPLVNSIRQQGKEVVVIGIGGAASTHLAQSADEFVFYEQLVGKAAPPPITTSVRARAAAALDDTPVAPAPTPAAVPEHDIYDVLVEAVHLVRKRGYVSTLGSLKLVMKELMGGDFKESRYKDVSGRPFGKFKDFVMDAERRGKVQIFTNGTVNEVFLPGEDPYKLSQFAAELKEESVDAILDVSAVGNGRQRQPVSREPEPTPSAPTSRRRRRRSRSQKQAHAAETAEAAEMPVEQTEAPAEETAPAAPPPVEGEPEPVPQFDAEELAALADPELTAAIAALRGEQTAQPAEAAPPAEPEVAEPATEAVAPEETALAEVGTPAIAPDEAAAPEAPAEVVESAPEPAAEAAPTEAPPADDEAAGEEEESQAEFIAFDETEWVVFRQMMAQFTRPVSFAQIFDTLRELRKQQALVRTNEQLRTMVKQAINSGLLERSGRGKRIYYRLKDLVAAEDGAAEAAEPAAPPPDGAAAQSDPPDEAAAAPPDAAADPPVASELPADQLHGARPETEEPNLLEHPPQDVDAQAPAAAADHEERPEEEQGAAPGEVSSHEERPEAAQGAAPVEVSDHEERPEEEQGETPVEVSDHEERPEAAPADAPGAAPDYAAQPEHEHGSGDQQ